MTPEGYMINRRKTGEESFPNFRSSRPEMFLGKDVLKICSKFAGEHPCQSAISIKLLCNFIEIALRHGRFLVNLLRIFRTPFAKNTSRPLLLKFRLMKFQQINLLQFPLKTEKPKAYTVPVKHLRWSFCENS